MTVVEHRQASHAVGDMHLRATSIIRTTIWYPKGEDQCWREFYEHSDLHSQSGFSSVVWSVDI
jgi:hypothetical protein